MTRDEILYGVKACIAEALNVDAEALTEDDKLIADLGADSLDLLDLTFHLQQRFGITISPRDMERRTREKLGDVPLEVDGVYTPAALEELRQAMPEIPDDELQDGLTVTDFPRRFRVATMANLVQRILEDNHA